MSNARDAAFALWEARVTPRPESDTHSKACRGRQPSCIAPHCRALPPRASTAPPAHAQAQRALPLLLLLTPCNNTHKCPSMFNARTMKGEEREIARHPTHDNPRPDRNLGFDWSDALTDIAGSNHVVIVVCEPHERELLGSPDNETWELWRDATIFLKERGLIFRHSSGAVCWGTGPALMQVEAELVSPADKQASACHPKPPEAIEPLYHPCNPVATTVPHATRWECLARRVWHQADAPPFRVFRPAQRQQPDLWCPQQRGKTRFHVFPPGSVQPAGQVYRHFCVYSKARLRAAL